MEIRSIQPLPLHQLISECGSSAPAFSYSPHRRSSRTTALSACCQKSPQFGVSLASSTGSAFCPSKSTAAWYSFARN